MAHEDRGQGNGGRERTQPAAASVSPGHLLPGALLPASRINTRRALPRGSAPPPTPLTAPVPKVVPAPLPHIRISGSHRPHWPAEPWNGLGLLPGPAHTLCTLHRPPASETRVWAEMTHLSRLQKHMSQAALRPRIRWETGSDWLRVSHCTNPNAPRRDSKMSPASPHRVTFC